MSGSKTVQSNSGNLLFKFCLHHLDVSGSRTVPIASRILLVKICLHRLKETRFFLTKFLILPQCARCLKITEKVSFNIASKASYVYILSGQKLIKNAKNASFWRVFWKPEACGQTVLPDRSVLKGQKLAENAKRQIFICDILCGQKLIKNAKNASFWRVFENLKLAVKQCYQTGQF